MASRRSVYIAIELLFLFGVLISIPVDSTEEPSENIKLSTVKTWADRISFELWHFGDYIIRGKELRETYQSREVEQRDGKKLLEKMTMDVRHLFNSRAEVAMRIARAAAELAERASINPLPELTSYPGSKQRSPLQAPPPYVYDETPKELPELPEMTYELNERFGDQPVNFSYSAVQVPTDVYEWDPEVVKEVTWSDGLNSVFIENYKTDPKLSWQYFGSHTGFMRQYPATVWETDPEDLFDTRSRPWYMQAAGGPRDLIILVDGSGSMEGSPKQIAINVVSDILDTLSNNDFVRIVTFTNSTIDVVSCFNRSGSLLMQATSANIREMKLGMEEIASNGFADVAAALTFAFSLLERVRLEGQGAGCGQAIMLIANGVPFNFKEVFEEYNWMDRPAIPVRLFVYLIGIEIEDIRDAKWMACANLGYFTHFITTAEVRAGVLNYVPVMARPLALRQQEQSPSWTPLYADAADSRMTDYLWEQKENEHQKNLVMSSPYYKTRATAQKEDGDPFHVYQLMTTVSVPVFDRRENASKEGNILGVAAADLPIEDIQSLLSPFQLGVNGYAFIVTNNGDVLMHPDLRPVFQGILKPGYSSVDVAELELIDDNQGPGVFGPELLRFRNAAINRTTGSLWLQTKYHYDNMRRVSRIRRQFYWNPIPDTPFTLVASLAQPYGVQRLRPTTPPPGMSIRGKWKVHPDWIYCRQLGKSFNSPEEEVMYFIERSHRSGWRWSSSHLRCDRELLRELQVDLMSTNWFAQEMTKARAGKMKEYIDKFGVSSVFLATHAGLTRWKTYETQEEAPYTPETWTSTARTKIPQFGELHARGTEEVWYRRAVEEHYISNKSFVYSVGFGAGGEADPVVTVSHAVFAERAAVGDPSTGGIHVAPAAVSGFQLRHSNLQSFFTNITMATSLGEESCLSEELQCYLVDNSGYVIVGEAPGDVGTFLGEVQPRVMRMMADQHVFRRVHITDYQAVCFHDKGNSNPAPKMPTLFNTLKHILIWLSTQLVWMMQNWSTVTSLTYPNPEEIYNDLTKIPTNSYKDAKKNLTYLFKEVVRTRPAPCEKEVWLYQLQQANGKEAPYRIPQQGCERPFAVQPVSGTNMALVVVYSLCGAVEEEPPGPELPLPRPLHERDSLPCERARRPTLLRRRPTRHRCINNHPNETQIKECAMRDPRQPPPNTAHRLEGIIYGSLLWILLMYYYGFV